MNDMTHWRKPETWAFNYLIFSRKDQSSFDKIFEIEGTFQLYLTLPHVRPADRLMQLIDKCNVLVYIPYFRKFASL